MENISRKFVEFGFTVTQNEYFDNESTPLRIMQQSSEGNANHPVHKHEFTELVIITGGKAMHQTEYGVIPLTAGDVFVVHEGHTHGYRDMENTTLINILFKAKRLPLPMADFGRSSFASVLFNGEYSSKTLLHLPPESLTKIMEYMTEIEKENQQKKSCYMFRNIAILMLFLTELERNFPHKHVVRSNDSGMDAALEFMENHFDQEIDFDRLAKSLGLSRRSFFRNFTLLTNNTPHKYLTEIRLRHALELLKNNAVSCAETAYRCGFASAAAMNYNCRIFYGKSIREVIKTLPRSSPDFGNDRHK